MIIDEVEISTQMIIACSCLSYSYFSIHRVEHIRSLKYCLWLIYYMCVWYPFVDGSIPPIPPIDVSTQTIIACSCLSYSSFPINWLDVPARVLSIFGVLLVACFLFILWHVCMIPICRRKHVAHEWASTKSTSQHKRSSLVRVYHAADFCVHRINVLTRVVHYWYVYVCGAQL